MRRQKAKTPDECALFLRALSDKVRLAIIALLFHREWSVTELVERLRISQPLVSHHLAILRSVGIVTTRREGRRIFYRLNPDFWHKLSQGEEIDLGCCTLRFRLPTTVQWVELDESETEEAGTPPRLRP